MFPPEKVAVLPAIVGAAFQGTYHADDSDVPGKSSKSKSVVWIGVLVGVLTTAGVAVGVLVAGSGAEVFVGVGSKGVVVAVGAFNPVGVGVGVLNKPPVVFCKIDTTLPSPLS